MAVDKLRGQKRVDKTDVVVYSPHLKNLSSPQTKLPVPIPACLLTIALFPLLTKAAFVPTNLKAFELGFEAAAASN